MVWGFDTGSLDGASARAHRGSATAPFLRLTARTGRRERHRARPTPPVLQESLRLLRHSTARGPPARGRGGAFGAPPGGSRSAGALAGGHPDARSPDAAAWTIDRWRAVERERGTLPPGSLEDLAVEAHRRRGRRAGRWRPSGSGVGGGPADPFEVDVELPDGTRIVGSVPLSLRGASPRARPGELLEAQARTPDPCLARSHDPGGHRSSERWRSVAVGRPADAGQSGRGVRHRDRRRSCHLVGDCRRSTGGGGRLLPEGPERADPVLSRPLLRRAPAARATPAGWIDDFSRLRRATIRPWCWSTGASGSTRSWTCPPARRPGRRRWPGRPVRRLPLRGHGRLDRESGRLRRTIDPRTRARLEMTDLLTSPSPVDDDLPERGLAIEASAGTGKTYALADLATRFLAESDISASELLIVTFTRAATNELRARVRERLIEVADRLEPGHPEVGDDRGRPPPGVGRRRRGTSLPAAARPSPISTPPPSPPSTASPPRSATPSA